MILFRDLASDPYSVIKKLYRFIGVDENFVPVSAESVVNAAQKTNYRYVFINRVLYFLRRMFRKMPKDKMLRKGIRLAGANKAFMKIMKYNQIKSRDGQKSHTPTIGGDTKKQLQNLYREDIVQLENLIGRDLSTWLQKE